MIEAAKLLARLKLSKPHTGTTYGLRHGTQFGVPMRGELVTVCVGMRGDAGQVKQCVPCRGENFEMFKNLSATCHDEIVTCTMHMCDIGCHAFLEQFVPDGTT